MADKTKCIKEATDTELQELIWRLQRETELQQLIRTLQLNSLPEELRPYTSYSISTEAPIESMYHHGVQGMKWGVRKNRDSGGGRKSSPSSEDHAETRKLQNKKTRQLSTNELKMLTNRLQLEKQYKDLSPSELKKGLEVVKTITAVGTTLASLYALSKTPLAQDIIRAVKNRTA